MTASQARSKVAVVATALGLAVLAAGPASTFGLGVPVVSSDGTTTQVTDTVQTVVDTTQTATTVTNVESTAQTTVETTTQPVAQQPAATTRPQAPASVPVKQVTTRATAPVTKQSAPLSRLRTAVQPAVKADLAKQAGSASSEPVRLVKRTGTAHTRKSAPPAAGASAADAPADCNVPALSLLPGGPQLQALLAIVCDAATNLDLPGRIGLVETTQSTPALGASGGRSTPGAPRLARGRAATAAHTTSGTAGRAAAGAAQASDPGSGLMPTAGAGAGRAGALAYLSAVNVAQTVPLADAAARDGTSKDHHHHAFFSGEAAGAEILLAIIIVNLAILAGIALWRLALRWVIPHFA